MTFLCFFYFLRGFFFLEMQLYNKFLVEWKKLEQAKPGTLKNRSYKFVRHILSREDPRESFLKSVPTDGGLLDLTYPDMYPERLVRRRLRLIARQGKGYHRRGLMMWSLLFIPQMPLMLTPLPNITVYYTLYRIWSHSRALKGSFVLDHGFKAWDAKQLDQFRERLIDFQQSTGVVFAKDSWAHRLVSGDRSYIQFFNETIILHNKRRLEKKLSEMLQKRSAAEEEESGQAMQPVEDYWPPSNHFEILDTGLHLYFAPSSELTSMIQGKDCFDESVLCRIQEHFEVDNLRENLARAKLYLKRLKE